VIVDPMIGRVVAGHRVDAVLGRGAMGVVYRVTHLQLNRTRALKLLPAHLAEDRDFRDRFEREWRLAAMIDHPSIVEVLDAGEEHGQLYIVMRYVEGTDLSGILRAGPVTPPRALRILEQVAGALDAAHARGLVHRDVKPSNILIGSHDHAYLSDFGIAKSSETSGLTQAGAFLGTIDFAAPEQFQGGELDARTDVYALGGVLFACLTGEPPYRRPTDMQVMHAHLLEPPPRATDLRPDLPAAVDHVISTALEKAKENRYQSAGALVAALREALGASETIAAGGAFATPPAAAAAETMLAGAGAATVPAPAAAAPAAPEPEGDKQRKRRRVIVAGLLAAAALAAVAVGAVLLTGGSDEGGAEEASGTTAETTGGTGGTTAGETTGGDTPTTSPGGSGTTTAGGSGGSGSASSGGSTGSAGGGTVTSSTGAGSSGTTTSSPGTDTGTSQVTSSVAEAPPPRWTRITPKDGSNNDLIAFARTDDGVLHVVSQRRAADGKGEIWHMPIGGDGSVRRPNPIVRGWAGVNKPDVIRTANGGLQVFFGGLRGQGPSDPNASLNTATSTKLGRRWALLEGSVTPTSSVYARSVGAALARDGTPVVAWDGNRTEAAYHIGVNRNGPEFRYAEKLGTETCGCPILPDIGVDSATGEVVLAWHSLLSNLPGIQAQTISRRGPGKAFRAPGSDRVASQRVAVTGRIGAPGVYVAYTAGSPVTDVRLWRARAAEPAISIAAPNVRFVGIAAAPQGRLWLMWARDQMLFVTRTNSAATKVGPILSVAPPKDATAIWSLSGEGSLGPLDLFTNASTPDSLATWHGRVQPALTIEASEEAGSSGGRTVTFRALDAGDPVEGATVRVGSATLTTGSDGTAELRQPTATTVTAVAEKAGYLAAETDV
jgi:serine/threonine-protein kinase